MGGREEFVKDSLFTGAAQLGRRFSQQGWNVSLREGRLDHAFLNYSKNSGMFTGSQNFNKKYENENINLPIV
jgi:hypothetical protein